MAGRIIVMKNAVQQVKGDCEVDEWKDYLKLDLVGFATTAYTHADSESGTVHQSSVVISLPFGPWVAELQQKLYQGTMLGDVDIIEVEQKVDAAATKSWKKIREITLLDGWIESMSHAWTGIHAQVQMTVQYTDLTLAVGDKLAHFSRTDRKGK